MVFILFRFVLNFSALKETVKASIAILNDRCQPIETHDSGCTLRCVLEHTALPSGSERQEGARRSLLLLQGLWVSRDTVLIAPHPIIAAFENVLFLKPHFPSLPVAILPQCHSLCGCHHGAFLVSFSDSPCLSFQL